MPSYKMQVWDAHVHIMGREDGLDEVRQRMTSHNLDKMALMSLTGGGDLSQNPLMLWSKARYPEEIIIFAGLDHVGYRAGLAPGYAEQMELALQAGFAGLKMIEGKPSYRRALGKRLDDAVFDQVYDLLEKRQVPIVFHVADPAPFWNPQLAPPFAKEQGWFYGDGTFPPYHAFYNEIESLLRKFPRLRLILAHFYFLSDDYQTAVDFLERHPTVSFDLTPGTEMFFNFSENPQKWRDFFIRYQDRLIFGTDNREMDDDSERQALDDIISTLRWMLEEDGTRQLWGNNVAGLDLPEMVLDKIYRENFRRLIGLNRPKALDMDLALKISRDCRYAAQKMDQTDAARKIESIEQEMQLLRT